MKKEEILSQLKEARKIIDHCVAALGTTGNTAAVTKTSLVKAVKPMKIDFTLNERNFVKTHAHGMNGQKKFVLLLAYVTKGKTGADVEGAKITSLWRKMTAKELLGYPYNDKYPTAAKTSGWVDSKKHGTYHLRGTWVEIFS